MFSKSSLGIVPKNRSCVEKSVCGSGGAPPAAANLTAFKELTDSRLLNVGASASGWPVKPALRQALSNWPLEQLDFVFGHFTTLYFCCLNSNAGIGRLSLCSVLFALIPYSFQNS